MIKIILILWCDNVSNNRFDEPATPIIPEPSNVNSAIESMCEIPRTGLVFTEAVLDIKVPAAEGSKVFFIQIGILAFKTG